MSTARPCVRPGCDTDDGQPVITTDVMCDRCRARFWRDLRWLVEDYTTIKAGMVRPVRPGDQAAAGTTRRVESFGHPAEWASDTCRDVAGLLDHVAREYATHTGGTLPTAGGGDAEPAVVARAYRYLTDRFHDLCSWPDIGHHAGAIAETHRTIRATLGQTRYVRKLPTPCPRCGLLSLGQETGVIWCMDDACGYVVPEQQYGWIGRLALDQALEAWETRQRDTANTVTRLDNAACQRDNAASG